MSFSRRVPASPLPCWEAFEEGRSQISSQTSSEGSDELEHEDETIVPSSPVQKRKTREDPSPVKTVKKPKLHSAPGDALNSRGRPAPRRRTLNINRDLPPVHGSGGTSSGSPLKSPTSTIPSTPSSNGQVNGRPRGGTPDSPDLTTVVSQVRKRPASQGSPLSATKSNQGKLNLPFFKHPGPVSASALSSKLIPTSSALKTPANKDQGKRPKSHTIPFPSTAPPAYRRRRSSLKIFARPSPLRTGSSPGPAHQGNDDDGSLDLTTPTPSPPPTRNFTQSGLETDPICIDSDDDGNANATPVKVKASSSGTLQYSPVVDLCSSEDEGPREEEEDEEGQPPVTFYRSPSPLAISPHLPTSSPEWEQNSAVDGVEPSMECEADLGAGTNVPAVSDQQDFLDEQNDGFKEGIPSMPVTVKRGMDYPEEAVVLDENQRAVPNHDIPTEDDSLPQDHSEYQSVGADWVLQTAADESTMKDEQSMLTVPDEEAMELSVIGTVYSVHEVHPESLRKSPVATAEAAVPAIQDDESPCQIYVSPSIPSGNTSAGLTGQDAEMSSHATSSPSVSSPSSLVNQRGKVVFKGSKYSRETGYLARAFRQLPSPSEPTTGNSCVRVSPTSQSALDNEPNEPFDIRRASTTSTAQQVAQTPHSSASAPSDASEERVEDLLEPASSQPEASESADLETPVTTAADNNTAEDLPHVSDALENDFSLVTDMSAMRLPFVTALSSYIENGKEVYDLTWDTDTEGVSDSEEAMASAMQLTDILPNYRSDFPGANSSELQRKLY
ncbi:hypothetical protein NEOLEDRAFT_683733 [Neolentinus lepideus HHB14362 ss-1]|uniref:Uncharacterized protein n=1 Tax=Neolentinus lepideus HHB14362 ss-1 TaxID=1314782 RepID=A0A165UZN0_9AGAM|nr:hypothetical protein NEOLEDRAFT_683733 [Neolentinus lepideus HHB14362 ss-1]